MAGPSAGILLLVKKAGTTIAGVQSSSIKFGLDTIDITSQDDAGFRKLLNAHTGQHFSITVSGVEKDTVLLTIWSAPATTKYLTDVTFTIPSQGTSADVFTGDVVMTAYEITGEHNGALMFNATFESAGSWAAA